MKPRNRLPITDSLRVNVGCGQTPTPGWLNLDASPSVRLARLPFLLQRILLSWFLNEDQKTFIKFALTHNIQYANAVRLPFANNSVGVLYSSHMIEHLDLREAVGFLVEARRVLQAKGILRVVVPDLARIVSTYNENRDANAFIEALHVCQLRPNGVKSRIRHLVAPGYAQHLWMYDAASLTQLLRNHMFQSITVCNPGETIIPNPGSLNLRERESESLYVEAVK